MGILFIANCLLFLATIGVWVILPEYKAFNYSVSAFFLSILALALYLKKKPFSTFVKSHFFKKLAETSVTLFLIVCIFGIINFLGFKKTFQMDFTKYQQNSLSPETISLLDKLDEKLEFILFSYPEERQTIIPLLDLYRLTGKNIAVTTYDPDSVPDLVRQYQVKGSGFLILKYKGQQVQTKASNELFISRAIIRLLNDESRGEKSKIYFTQGQGESDLADKTAEGISLIKEHLVARDYQIQGLNLLDINLIPDDAAGLVIMAPKNAWPSNYILKLKEYLNRGGHVWIGIDPQVNVNKNDVIDKFVNLKNLVKDFGVIIHNDLVIDKVKFVNGSNGWVPIVDQLATDHLITRELVGTLFFPLTSSLEVLAPPPGVKIKELALSSAFPGSWAESNFDDLKNGNSVSPDEKDRPGPLPMMMAIETAKGKLIVLGSGSFVKNAYFGQGSNVELFERSLTWLVDPDFKIAPVQKDAGQVLFISGVQVNTVLYFCLLFGPLILLSMALWSYRRRYL
jgi:hypothetical protein